MCRLPLVVEVDKDDPECAIVMVDGTVAERPYRFILDTGTARTEIVADEATATLSAHMERSSSGLFAPSSTEVAVVTLPDVALGPLTGLTLDAVRVDATQSGACNLLGMDMLRQHCCHFLFDSDTLVLQPTGAAGTVWPLEMDEKSHAYVDVSWPGVTAHACWDSGAGITVVDEGFRRNHAHWFREAGMSTGTDSSGAQLETPTFLMAGATIGTVKFAPHKVAAVDLSYANANANLDRPMDLILGYTTLRQANWLFDFPAQRWGITPRPSRNGQRANRP